MSKNTKLMKLDCGGNQLKRLDLRTVPALNYLLGYYWFNQIPLQHETNNGIEYDIYSHSDTTLKINATVGLVSTYTPFTDVAAGKYYYTPVCWVYYFDPQVTTGTDSTHFSPNKTCTRGQVVTFLHKAMEA